MNKRIKIPQVAEEGKVKTIQQNNIGPQTDQWEKDDKSIYSNKMVFFFQWNMSCTSTLQFSSLVVK